MRLTDTQRRGKKRSLIAWKKPPEEQDTFGGTPQSNNSTNYEAWETYSTQYGNVQTDRGRELVEGKRDNFEVIRTIIVDYDSNALPREGMVGLNGNSKYYVVELNDVGDRHKTVEITVREIKNGA